MRLFGIALIVVLPALAQEYSSAAFSQHILTNESIVTLAKSGFDELFIVERIRTSRTHFDTSVEGLIALKQAGLTEELIHFMALHDVKVRKQAVESLEPKPPEPYKIEFQKRWWGYRWARMPSSRQ